MYIVNVKSTLNHAYVSRPVPLTRRQFILRTATATRLHSALFSARYAAPYTIINSWADGIKPSAQLSYSLFTFHFTFPYAAVWILSVL